MAAAGMQQAWGIQQHLPGGEGGGAGGRGASGGYSGQEVTAEVASR